MSIIIVQQRVNQLISMIDKMQTKVSSPSITNMTITTTNPVINFNNITCMSFSLTMTSNITNITFQNSVVNGMYKIYLQSSGFVMNKILGINIRNNLSGNTFMVGYWIIDVFYNGNIYFCNFQNFT